MLERTSDFVRPRGKDYWRSHRSPGPAWGSGRKGLSRIGGDCSRREFLIGSAAAAAAMMLGCHRSAAPAGNRRNLLLIVVDTLRADYLQSLGFPLPTSPRMDALAGEGVSFQKVMSCAPLTAAAHASLMTGAYQTRHGVVDQHGRMSDRVPTLAQVLREQSYETAAIVSNPVLVPENLIGIDRGFGSYRSEFPSMERNRESPYRDVSSTAAEAVEWLRREHTRPFFLWVHFQEPHGPYEVPDGELLTRIGDRLPEEADPAALPVLDGEFGPGGIPRYQVLGGARDPAVYRARYAARATYVDQYVGQLLDCVGDAGLDGNTVVALTSDHGELLGEQEYYFQHGITLLWPVLHVPLILRGPGVPSGRAVPATAGTVDIAPTLLDLLGLPPADSACCPDGESLVPWMRDPEDARQTMRYALCQRSYEVCAILGNHKYTMRVPADGAGSLIDVDADAAEERDLSMGEEELTAALRADAMAFLDRAPGILTSGPGARPELSEEDRRRLKALGYF